MAQRLCRRLVVDMHYEARVQAVVTYYGEFLGQKVPKPEARDIHYQGTIHPGKYIICRFLD